MQRSVLRKLAALGLGAIALGAVVLTGSVPGPATAAGSATLIVTPSSQFVASSGLFDVTITQNASGTTTGAQADLVFDKSLVKVLDVEPASPAYTAAQFVVGESVPAGAAAAPRVAGAPEFGADCTGAVDNDGDGLVNDGCLPWGAAETVPQCANNADDDSDGRVNDGCAAVAAAEVDQCEVGTDVTDGTPVDDDADGTVNDGCAAVGAAEITYQCVNAVDDDADGRMNDGCVNVPANGAEFESDCTNAIDNDFDGFVNDGCPQDGPGAETGAQCANAIDDDGDTLRNDGCKQIGGGEPEVVCQDNVDFAGDGDGVVNDGCPAKGPAPAVAPEAGPNCANNTDDDADDYVNDGCPASGTSEIVAPCTNTVDNDGDTVINDGCASFSKSESGTDCTAGNTADENGNGVINDGCTAVAAAETNQCGNATDNDGDAAINDGCSNWGAAESGSACDNAVDDDGDGRTNDGCPRGGAAESGGQCGNSLDEDNDQLVDDGCPESGGQCSDSVDSDADGVIDDGCFPPNETGGQCNNVLDDDADGRINDGCPATEPAAILDANTNTGILKKASVFFVPSDGSVPSGSANAIVVHMQALAVVCGVSPLTLTNAELLDDVGDPLTTVTITNGVVGISLTDADCDTYGNPQQTLHVAPANTDVTKDNCPFANNNPQTNTDGNFSDNSPPYVVATDDKTMARSDNQGDACDADDDNDYIPDTTETNLVALQAVCPTALATTNPLLQDTDNDRVIDGAECALGSDPNNIASKPANPPPANDPDSDRLSTAFEGIIGTNPALVDTDGDGLQDGWEYKGHGSNPLVVDGDGDGVRDGCEVGSVNGDNIVNPGDQALLAAEILRAVPPVSKLTNFDMNKDGVYNPGDQAFQASKIGPGKCP